MHRNPLEIFPAVRDAVLVDDNFALHYNHLLGADREVEAALQNILRFTLSVARKALERRPKVALRY